MTDTLFIDGSRGEGGGQVVRTALALSLVTGREIKIENIRAGRERPGLMRQHLTAIKAAVDVSRGHVEGASLRSRAIRFAPGRVQPGQYHFSVGTAGSATLVLQTVLPALLVADGRSTLLLEGGTHNPWSPPFDFLEKAYIPLINRMGPRVMLALDQHGFFPAGGGQFRVQIEPSPTLSGFDLCERGKTTARRARVLLANLPAHIATRELDRLADKLGLAAASCAVENVSAPGPGNVVIVEIESEHVTEVFTSFGRKGTPAEDVADEVIAEVSAYLAADVPLGPYLADQLLLPLGISAWQPGDAAHRRGGTFRTTTLTRHATTQIDLLRMFLGVAITVETAEETGTCLVRIAPPQ